MMTSRLTALLRADVLYSLVTGLAAVVALGALYTADPGPVPAADYLLFGALFAILSTLSVPLPLNAMAHPSAIAFFAAMYVLPPWAAASIPVIFYVPAGAAQNPRWRWYHSLFNRAQNGLSASTATLFFYTTYRGFGNGELEALFGAALAYFAVNTLLVSGAIRLTRGLPLARIWAENFAWTIPGNLLLTLTAPLAARLYYAPPIVGTWSGINLLLLTLIAGIQAYTSWSREQKQRQAFLGAVETLVTALEAKSPYTRNHSERVAQIARVIGQELGLNPVLIERLEAGARLHDIGKIGLEDAILELDGPIGEYERHRISEHTLVGEQIVQRMPHLEDLAPIVRHHHERYDGKGYPDGLKGDEIPLLARIVAVADAFDAMTTDRPYRRALSKEEALAELEKHAGTQFDPKVVEAFLKTQKQKR